MELGKPIGEARAGVEQAVAVLRYYAQMVLALDGKTYPASRSKDWLITRTFPLRVCALITPWTSPVAIPRRFQAFWYRAQRARPRCEDFYTETKAIPISHEGSGMR